MRVPGVRRWWLPVVAVVMAAVCIRLGFWQLDRLQTRRGANAAMAAGLASPTVDAAELLASGPADDLAYRPVSAVGVYDPTHELVLYGRPLPGRPGDHVLTPMVLDDGTRLLVDRGWIPFAADPALPLQGAAAAPPGRVEVRGIAMASEDGDAFGDADPSTATVVRSVNLVAISEATETDLAPVYVLLQDQRPSQALPVPAPIGEPDEGPHLSYAIQWFAFAMIAVVGAMLLRRRPGRARSGSG